MNMNWHTGGDPRQRWFSFEVILSQFRSFMNVSNDKQTASIYKRNIAEDVKIMAIRNKV